jgi:peptidoglycan-N-acetylglucosamine deacetylase
MYFLKTPWIIRKIWPHYTWRIETNEPLIYLTFDDGPHPEATPFVLDELGKYNAKATFFCIGKNVERYPDIYQRILDEGHATGNHTQHHMNGWNVKDEDYLRDIKQASRSIKSSLFRPPYGRIKATQYRNIATAMDKTDARVIMWSILSGDFDTGLTGKQCAETVTRNAANGSIVVFHDSEKALPRLREALPVCLQILAEKGYRFEKLGGF